MQGDIEAIRVRIAVSYEAWGLGKEAAQRDHTSHEQLSEMLKSIAAKIPSVPCSIVPFSFDPAFEPMLAYPRPIESVWDSCVTPLEALGCTGVMMRTPLFWQTEQTLFRACKKIGAFIFVNDAANMPLGALGIDVANIDAVVTDAADASAFSRYLADAKKRGPKLWIVVHDVWSSSLSSFADLSDQSAAIAREVDVFPGVALLRQCATLARQHSSLLHGCADYVLESSEKGTLVTSAKDEPFPLWRYQLPFFLTEKGTCACGEELLELRSV